MFKVGEYFNPIALGTHVRSSCQDAVEFVGILDDFIDSILRFGFGSRFGKVDILPICAFDDHVCRAIVTAFVVRTRDVTTRVREG